MRILQINGGIFGSTGNIMFGIEKISKELGHETLSCSPITEKKTIDKEFYIIEKFEIRKLNAILDYLCGLSGSFAINSTKKLISKIKDFHPDVIQIHTLHGSFINLKIFTNFLKQTKINVVWTFHDCWPFTGRCPHFSSYNCLNWQNGCRTEIESQIKKRANL